MQLLIPTPGDWATAIRWQLWPCSPPPPCLSGGNPLLLMGLNWCWKKSGCCSTVQRGWAAARGSKSSLGCADNGDNEGEGIGVQEQVWGPHRCGVTTTAGRDRKRSRQGMAYIKQHFIISKWPQGRRHCLPECPENVMNSFYPAAFWATWAELCM